MTITKVVVLVISIPEQLSLYFSDFYTILYVFYKFAVLKFMYILQFGPWKFRSFNCRSLAEMSKQRRNGGAISGEVRPRR